ncbi:thioredoxin family protein [Sporosarcina sp. G11-34]|uniref:thioredoxin family protein n=1 Tax=Sporosarcina sp. G11-34 TaxID=2849605 RepID=UPI0022A9DCBB|nr:thioredoxin family protein [Sporosarcina sp. G11-34]MCZ2260194.1 thioredoxin family protein [Sporosarcina sp. G11-34]
MKTEKQYFDEAISLTQYMDKMEQHKESSFRIYEQFEVPQDDEFIDLLKEKNPEILVITEDWCGDAMMNNPVFRRIAEAAELDVRAVYRDEDTDLIDRYLTNGGRSIPMYLFLGEDGKVKETWGPRAAQIQEYVMGLRQSMPPADAPEYKEKQQEFVERISAEYTSKPEYWLTVYEDIRNKFLPILQKQS